MILRVKLLKIIHIGKKVFERAPTSSLHRPAETSRAPTSANSPRAIQALKDCTISKAIVFGLMTGAFHAFNSMPWTVFSNKNSAHSCFFGIASNINYYLQPDSHFSDKFFTHFYFFKIVTWEVRFFLSPNLFLISTFLVRFFRPLWPSTISSFDSIIAIPSRSRAIWLFHWQCLSISIFTTKKWSLER